MGRFHGYVPKMHPIYLCAGTASHIGDFSDYACYVAVLFLQEDAGDNNTTSRKVKVSDIASAKDYLADTFGISRTSMRSTKAIMEQAAANGIEFEGLE